MRKEDVKEEIRKLGYKVIYVPHKTIEDHVACYRVKYKGKIVYPPAAEN